MAVRQAFETEIEDRIDKGWRIEEQTPTHVLMAKGERIKHGVHIFLSIVTVGVWGVVYGLLLLFGGLKERRIVRKPNGLASVQRVGM